MPFAKKLFTCTPALIAALIFSCKESEKKTPINYNVAPVTTINIDKLPEDKSIADQINSIEFIPLETNDSCFMAGMDKVVIHDQTMYLLDRKYSSLHAFSLAGKYITRIGEIGIGPGQFRTLNDFQVKDSSLLLMCNDKKSILSFSLQGKYQYADRINLFAYNFENLNNQWYFFINQNKSDKSGNNNLIVMDASMHRVTDRLFSFPKAFNGSIGFSGFLRKNQEGLLYSDPLSDTIFQITPQYIYPKYAYSFGNNSIPAEIKKSFASFTGNSLKYSYAYNNVFESPDFLTFSFVSKQYIKFGFYDRKTNNMLGKSTVESDVFSRLVNETVGITNDHKFIGLISPGYLLKVTRKDQELLNAVKTQWPGLYNIMGNLKEDGNPILVFYTLKPITNDKEQPAKAL